MNDDRRPIALIGLMGAGKSVVAERLGQRLRAPVADLDALIERESGSPISELFAREGEVAFRRREAEMLERVLTAGIPVIACGGGLVIEPAPRDRLRRDCRVVWLEVSPGEAARRIEATRGRRPMLGNGEVGSRLGELLREREALYAEAAELRVTTDRRTPDEVVDAVLAELRRA